MVLRIEADQNRFKKIVTGKVRENLRKYVSNGEMIGKKGKDLVSIPLPNLDVPHFRFGDSGSGGTGQGEGEIGQPIGRGQGQQGEKGQAGSEPGGHILEVDFTIEELAKMLKEELELELDPKGKNCIEVVRQGKVTYKNLQLPQNVVRNRTYLKALKRHLATKGSNADPTDPDFYPRKVDFVNKDVEVTIEPEANALIAYMIDVSGSMGDEQKKQVRKTAFWVDAWLKSEYDGVEKRYIIFDAAAKMVDEDTFYRTRESGGTRISSALKIFNELVLGGGVQYEGSLNRFPPDEWNVYGLLFSDGDNWGEDEQSCIEIIQKLTPQINRFCYGQTESPYGSGSFYNVLEGLGIEEEKLRLFSMESDDDIPECIRAFFAKS